MLIQTTNALPSLEKRTLAELVGNWGASGPAMASQKFLISEVIYLGGYQFNSWILKPINSHIHNYITYQTLFCLHWLHVEVQERKCWKRLSSLMTADQDHLLSVIVDDVLICTVDIFLWLLPFTCRIVSEKPKRVSWRSLVPEASWLKLEVIWTFFPLLVRTNTFTCGADIQFVFFKELCKQGE